MKKDVGSKAISFDIQMDDEPLLNQAGREACNMNLVQGAIMKQVWLEENNCNGSD